MLQHLKKKEGFAAVEAVVTGSFFLIFFLLVIGFFIHIYAQGVVNRDVHALATIAEQQGGLTSDNISDFTSRMEGYSFHESGSSIEISAVTSSGIDATGVSLSESEDSFYISRSAGDYIQVRVDVPVSNPLLQNAANFFGVGASLKSLQSQEVVFSERY